MCGGGWPKLPFGLDQWVFALPFGLVIPLLLGFSLSNTSVLVLSLVSYLGAVLFKRKGHGQWMDVGNMPYNPDGREDLDYLVALFFGPDKGFEESRDLFGLAVSGLSIHLGLVGALLYSSFFVGAAIVALGGITKTVAYWIGWSLFEPYNPHTNPEKTKFYGLNHPTVFGEFFTGVFSYLSIGLAYYASI